MEVAKGRQCQLDLAVDGCVCWISWFLFFIGSGVFKRRNYRQGQRSTIFVLPFLALVWLDDMYQRKSVLFAIMIFEVGKNRVVRVEGRSLII